MHFQIAAIVLWPRKEGQSPRVLPLATGAINIISGASKTGKSAIIPIVDYCLGSDRCAIPVDTIRDACCWFGVIIDIGGSQILFARREPGEQKSTGDMYLIEGPQVEVPQDAPTKNTTVDAVKARLDELCGLSRLDMDPDATSGFRSRPSFRDLMAFTFQPQNIVANPDVLFFKADTYEHREKLKAIFPYVLKAVTPEILVAMHELEEVRRALQRKERELFSLQQVSERWLAELRSLVVRARELGLINQPVPADADRSLMLDLLVGAAATTQPEVPTLLGIDEAMAELANLQNEESSIDSTLRELRRRFSEMTKLRDTAAQVRDSLKVQRDRIGISDWLVTLDHQTQCPLCASTNRPETTSLEELVVALRKLEGEVKKVGAAPAAFDRELAKVRSDMELNLEKMKGIAIRKGAVERRSSAVQEANYRSRDVSRFLGGIDRILDVQKSLGHDGELNNEVANLRTKQSELEKKISRPGIESRRRRALERVSNFAGRLLPLMDSERPDDPIELSVTDLTIKVKSSSREDYLWEIGSGANWLAYHVSVSLALQQLFIADAPSPVPGFLVYDQPSQVYFPRRLARTQEGEDEDPQLGDEDIEAVRKIFETVASVISTSKGELQVLILDHAPPEVWDGVEGINLVEEWRDGRKLVPLEWLS